MWKHGPGMALLHKLEDAAIVLQNWWRLRWIPLLRRRKRSAILIQVCVKINEPVLIGLIVYNSQAECDRRYQQE